LQGAGLHSLLFVSSIVMTTFPRTWPAPR
jgi:hypothetical protein